MWCVKFEAYSEFVGFGVHMEATATHNGVLTLAEFGQQATDVARALYALLISKCEAKALDIVLLGEKHNGLDAWRRLKEEYEAKTGGRFAAMLRLSLIHI